MSSRRVGTVLLRVQFVLCILFLQYHTFCFLFGILWKRQDYPLIPTLIMSCAFVTGFSMTFKHQMLNRKRTDLGRLMAELNGFTVDTTVGKYTRWMIYMYEGMGLFFNVITVLRHGFMGPVSLDVPFPVWEPYEVNSGLTRLSHFFCFHYAIGTAWLCMVSTDTVMLHLTNQLCYRLEILNHTLQEFGSREGQPSRWKVLSLMDQNDKARIKACVDEHVLLLRLIKISAKILNEAFVYQCINSMAVLLVCLYVFANSDSYVRDTLNFSGALVVVFIQVLTSCWAGELLKTQSEKLHFAVYNNDWATCDPVTKSSLLVMATFTSPEVNLKGAYVFNLSLQTYETFIRQAFSFFTVMYQFLN